MNGGEYFTRQQMGFDMQIEWILKWYLMTIFVAGININCSQMKMQHQVAVSANTLAIKLYLDQNQPSWA